MGPFVGASSSGGLAAWVASGPDGSAWSAQAFDAQGSPHGAPRSVAPAPAEIGLATLKPIASAAAGGPLKAGGYALLFTERTAAGEGLSLIALGPKGELASGPSSLSRSDDQVIWLAGVPTAAGAVAVWASRTGDRAELHVLDISDAARQSLVLTKSARAWQSVAFAGGAAVAWIDAGSGPAVNGPVMLALLDERGAPKGKSVQISDTATAALDLDMAATAQGVIVGWSDRREVEARVQLALVDHHGKVVVPPASSLPSAGEQTLVDLAAPVQGLGPAYAVWESPGQSADGDRWLEVASLDQRMKPSKRARLRVAGDGTIPELIATTGGVTALTLAESCPAAKKTCAGSDLLPTFVRLNKQLEVVASEPLRTTEFPGGITLAWGLSCSGESCYALAADTASPARLFSIELAASGDSYRAAAEAWIPAPPPRLEANRAIATAEPLSDLAVAMDGAEGQIAWLTYFDPSIPYVRRKTPAPDGRFDPVRAVLKVQSLDAGDSAPTTVSYRARSLGGVALSAGDPAKHETLLVWSALDNKQPQVFVTLLARTSKKISQQMLTRAPGDVSDVAAGYVADSPAGQGGWIVAWVDERHGDAEVYAARIGKGLQRVGPDRRVSSAPGAATGVQVLPRGDSTWLAWSEARDPARAGMGDIYWASLKSATAEPLPGQRVLLKTPGHSHSPVLVASGAAAVVGWVEEGDQAGLRVLQLSADGRAVGQPMVITLPDSALPTSLSLDCTGDQCRGVASASRGATSELYGFQLRLPASLVRLRRLSALDGPTGQSVSPTLRGDSLWFADQREGQGYLRRGLLAW